VLNIHGAHVRRLPDDAARANGFVRQFQT
jgi:hypothetical protein